MHCDNKGLIAQGNAPASIETLTTYFQAAIGCELERK